MSTTDRGSDRAGNEFEDRKSTFTLKWGIDEQTADHEHRHWDAAPLPKSEFDSFEAAYDASQTMASVKIPDRPRVEAVIGETDESVSSIGIEVGDFRLTFGRMHFIGAHGRILACQGLMKLLTLMSERGFDVHGVNKIDKMLTRYHEIALTEDCS